MASIKRPNHGKTELLIAMPILIIDFGAKQLRALKNELVGLCRHRDSIQDLPQAAAHPRSIS